MPEPESMLVNEAQSAIDNLNGLADGDDSTDPLGYICTGAVDVIEKYQQLSKDAVSILRMLRVELQYALEAFQDQCQCKNCGPCKRQSAFETALRAEKKIWSKLTEAK